MLNHTFYLDTYSRCALLHHDDMSMTPLALLVVIYDVGSSKKRTTSYKGHRVPTKVGQPLTKDIEFPPK